MIEWVVLGSLAALPALKGRSQRSSEYKHAFGQGYNACHDG
jgi:hypothetical protein